MGSRVGLRVPGVRARRWALLAAFACLFVPEDSFAHSDDMTFGELEAMVATATGETPDPADAVAIEMPDGTIARPPADGESEQAWYVGAPVSARIGSTDDDVYGPAGGCFGLASDEGYVAEAEDGDGYSADAPRPEGEVFRFQPSDLGTYLLLGSGGRFPTQPGADVEAVEGPTHAAEWTLEGEEASGYELISESGDGLAVGDDGELIASTEPDRFDLRAAGSCAAFPEIEVNATGKPYTASPLYGQSRGTIDLHSHIMAFQAFGKGLHCGRGWSPLGVEEALSDCDSHFPNGLGGVEANLLVFQDPTRTHDPEGWPSFEGWPTYEWVFTHEQTYYRWIERSWRGGQRLLTFLAFDNSAACLVNTRKTESCNEMDAVRRQLRSIKQMQDYIDAQWGGPGKGFFRIVKNPFQARRVINRGKLAVVLGMEVSEPFDCGLRNGVSQCDEADVDAGLDEMRKAGVRQMEIVNKFDNAFTGVAMDGGFQGPVINGANKITTGEFWDVDTCEPGEEPDREQVTSIPGASAQLLGMLPGGALQIPAYPPAPHCNTRGLSDLGRYLIRGMEQRHMIFDPDHMSSRARVSALELIDRLDYSGLVSSHSWSDDKSYKQIMELGGVVTPMADHADEFEDDWAKQRELYAEGKGSKRFGFGFGYGDDMNGFGGPRHPTAGTDAEITYPFRSPIDRGVMLDRQVSGTKSFDMNTDGVAHFGQWPDWIEGVRQDAGEKVIHDLRGGAESYLRMWERAVGVPGPHKVGRKGTLGPGGTKTIRLRMSPKRLLRSAGQPEVRTRGWRWRVRGSKAAVMGAAVGSRNVEMVATTAPGYSAGGAGVRAGSERLLGRARSLGGGIWTKAAAGGARYVYGVAGGRISFVAVATRPASASAAAATKAARRALGAGR